ncbi:hypothetical protein D3C75_1161630 [compost metagenome]
MANKVAATLTMMNAGMITRFWGSTDTKANSTPSQEYTLTIYPTVKPTSTPLRKSRANTSGSPMTDRPSTQIRPSHFRCSITDCWKEAVESNPPT